MGLRSRKIAPKMGESLYWLAQTTAELPENEDWLSEGERSLLEKMRFPKRRSDWKLGRWTAKQAVRAYRPGESPILPLLEIRASTDGAPEVFFKECRENISLSLSHSRNRCFCVIGPGCLAIGCDVEFIESRDDRFVEDYFTGEEIDFCKRCKGDEIAVTANIIWSAKESILKLLREGLRRDTRSISVHPDFPTAEGVWSCWTGRCLDSSRLFWGWWRVAEGYVYTVASNQPIAVPEPIRI